MRATPRRAPVFALAACLPCAGLATADTPPGPVQWVIDRSDTAAKIDLVGHYDPKGPVIAVDPLTWGATHRDQWLPGDGAATLWAAFEPEEGRVAQALLVWHDAPPVCGGEDAIMLVDTGTGAFLGRDDAMALEHHITRLADNGQNPYDDWLAGLEPADPYAALLPIPGGGTAPIFTTGWGDGAYPVTALEDADGRVVALLADFLGDDAGQWIALPPCPRP